MGRAGIADPEQLSILCKVLDEHCQRHGIGENSQTRANIASKLLAFYDLGIITEDGLADALNGFLEDRLRA